MVLVQVGLREEARYVVLTTASYLRPGEALRLRAGAVIPPQLGVAALHSHWSVVLHPSDGEEARPSKTLEFDETVILDQELHSFIGPALGRLAQSRHPLSPLFSFEAPRLARAFRKAGEALRLDPLPMLYQLRHSGASHDAATKSRSMLETKLRGRWRSDSSPRRYEKGGRLGEQLQRLEPRVRAFCLRAARELPGVLSGRLSPSAPPRRAQSEGLLGDLLRLRAAVESDGCSGLAGDSVGHLSRARVRPPSGLYPS